MNRELLNRCKNALGDIENAIESIESKELKSLVRSILDDYAEKFAGSSASYKHHNYEGGLLIHTSQVVKTAISIGEQYKNVISMDLLITGAILHDIGKAHELYEASGENRDEYAGHPILGVAIVSKYLDNNDNISQKLKRQLINIVATHMVYPFKQVPEIKTYGRPMLLETQIVHFADGISTLIDQALEVEDYKFDGKLRDFSYGSLESAVLK